LVVNEAEIISKAMSILGRRTSERKRRAVDLTPGVRGEKTVRARRPAVRRSERKRQRRAWERARR
jgi:hypothetical protein